MSKSKQLFVFDLDFTLWDAGGTWCDCTNPPYKIKNGKVHDANGYCIRLYHDVLEILNELTRGGKKIAIASRTQAPSYARQLMKLLEIEPFIHFEEIYPSGKIQHFNNIQKNSGIDFRAMVFFDDEHRNIADVSQLGVECVLVNNGINRRLVEPYI
jgi:magnesium-dependent phosphatase 1